MPFKQFLRARKNVLAQSLKVVLVAVLPAKAAMKVASKVASKAANEEKKTTVKTIINKQAEDVFEKPVDESINTTEKVISRQEGIVNQTIEPEISMIKTPIETEEPKTIEVAPKPIQSEAEIAKRQAYFWRAIIEGPNGKPFTSLTTGSLHTSESTPPSPSSLRDYSLDTTHSAHTSPFTYTFLPPTTSYLELKEEFEYHCTCVAEHPEDPVAMADFNDFQYRIYFPNRA